MTDFSQLTIIIPVFNEAQSLPGLLPEILQFCKTRNFLLLAVNDASTDDSADILQAAASQWDGMTVITHKVNRGYGGALSSGLAQAQTPYAITIDADGQHRLDDVDALMSARKRTDADMVIGRRSENSRNFQQAYRSLGKKIIRGIAKVLVDLPVQDLNSGMKLYDTSLAQRYLPLCPDGMAFSDVMTLIFLQQKHLVIEEPIEVLDRKAGLSTINTMTAFDTVIQILNIVMVFNPLRIFLPVGLIAILAGLLWAVPFFIRGHGLSTVAMLSITTGLILIMLGLIAEQLSQIRRKNL